MSEGNLQQQVRAAHGAMSEGQKRCKHLLQIAL